MSFVSASAPKKNLGALQQISSKTITVSQCTWHVTKGNDYDGVRISINERYMKEARFMIGDLVEALVDREAGLCLIRRTSDKTKGRMLQSAKGTAGKGTFTTGYFRFQPADGMTPLFFPLGVSKYEPEGIAVKDEGIVFQLPKPR